MAWYHRLINVVRPDRVSGDLEREIAAHLAERTDDLVAAGMSERDAAEAARRRFGNRTMHKERARDADGFVWLESLIADVRYAVRALRMSPGFHARGGAVAGARHRRQHRDLFADECGGAQVAAGQPSGKLMLVNMGGTGERPMTNPLWEQLRDLRRTCFRVRLPTRPTTSTSATAAWSAGRREAG